MSLSTLANRAIPLALILTLVLPVATAQVGTFGSQVKLGDLDYVPQTKAASIAISVNEADLGTPGSAIDNCILLDTASTAAAGAQLKDVRLTACLGKAAGTLIEDADTIERGNAYPRVPAAVLRYVDINANAKYDKGDYVYLTTAASGLVATRATGTWTIRVTPVLTYAAATFVKADDSDVSQFGASAAALTMSVAEREDKGWYFINNAVGYAKNSLIPANSLRVGGPVAGQPDVRPSKADVVTPDLVTGRPFQVSVEVINNGLESGSGLVIAKLDDVVVSVTPTVELSSKETSTLVLTIGGPKDPGPKALKVGDLFQVITFVPAEPLQATGPVVSTEDLLNKISELEARLALLETEATTKEVEIAQVEPVVAQNKKAPMPDAVFLFALVIFGMFILRRRAQ